MANNMAKSYFNVVDILVAFISLVTFLLDVGTDIAVCIHLFLDDQTVWGWLVAVFITLSAVFMSVVSVIWNIQDKTATPVIVVSHLLLVAPIERYLNVIWLGVKSYRTRKVLYTQKALRALSDVSVLRLIEAFLQSAPQLVLQMYILLCERRISWIIGFSVSCSLLSLTWAMTAYCDTQCSAHSASNCRHTVRLLLHWGWQLFMTAARITAFVLFACVLHSWMFAVMGAHWLISFVWISVRGTDYGKGYEKWLFRLVCAFMYIFVFLNLNKGKSRWRITAYYLMMLLENKAMLVVFLIIGDTSMTLVSCLVVFAGFFTGLVCMLMYYAFFHPSGAVKHVTRLFFPYLSQSGTSRSSTREETGLQIFSIESPKTLSFLENASSQSSCNTSSLPMASTSVHISHLDESSNSLKKTNTSTNSLQKSLRMVWQSGMKSSSDSSSSSLVSTENRSGLIKRTSSFHSDKSHDSATSDSSLLAPLPGENLSKSSKKNSVLTISELDCPKQEQSHDVSQSNNMNVLSGRSKSPTLSRDSWSMLSDQNRKSLVLEDITSLGFDESSSTDKRVSDSSSLSSQAKSLNPLDVSNLWRDVHVRLRATIAATIAAATGSSSSTDDTPNRNQSVSSSNSAVLSQEDSLNSTNNASVFSHNTAFMDSNSSYKETLNTSQQNNVPLFPQFQESKSALPDMFESFVNQELSVDETRGRTCESNKMNTTLIPALAAMNCSSPFQLDSTLTVSKLELQKSKSYLASQMKPNSDYNTVQPSSTPVVSSYRSPVVQNSLNVPNSGNPKVCKGDSPFTDQELVALMAKSLRNYVEGNSSFDSNQPEREGLALTLEDLRVSREGSPETSPLSHRIKGTWKSQSVLSMTQNSKDSSPASSASKMNRVVSVKNADTELSPNAFKQIENLPQRLQSLEDLRDNVVAIVPHSHALKFIMDSYGSTAITDHSVSTPIPQKSFFQTPPNCNQKSRPSDMLHQQFLPHSNRTTSDVRMSSGGRGKNTPQRQIHYTNQAFDRAKHSEVRGGVSSTKKLNVHFSAASQLDNKKSSGQVKHIRGSNSVSDGGDYVSGQYFPPLCAREADSEVNYTQQNLGHDSRNLKYDLNRGSQSFLGESIGKKHNSQTDDLELFYCQRREASRRDSYLHKQRPDLLTLQHSESASQNPSPSHPYQYIQSPTCQLSAVNGVQKIPNITEKLGRTTHLLSHDVHELTDSELHLSAEHVAEYFSKALDVDSINKDNGARPKVHCSQTSRQVSGHRQPLQRLENSQLLSPETNNLRNSTWQISNKLPNSQTQGRRLAEIITGTSSEGLQQRLGHELLKNHQKQHTKDLPRGRVLFESDQSSRLASRPPLIESNRATPRSSIKVSGKSSSEVRFLSAQDRDQYVLQKQHITKTKGLPYYK
ncbi:hypothetical protein BsWGS_02788 [Bradybaena similaris]